MTWRVYLVETKTGRAGRALSPGSFTWSDELNLAGGGKLTIQKKDLKGLDRLRYQAWWASVVICHVDSDGTEVPWVGGPITARPRETLRTIEAEWAGMREMFYHRYVDRNLDYSDLTYGQLAWELIKAGQLRPGGELPIVHGTPDEAGDIDRKFEFWNMANNRISKYLSDYAETADGPDIMFRPRWAEYGTRFEWEMVHGTKVQPTIAQSWTPVWDTTADKPDVVDVDITENADSLSSVTYATGAGEGGGTCIGWSIRHDLVKQGYPWMDTVISDRDEKDTTKLVALARGHQEANMEPIDQLSITVRADSTKNPLGRWHVGDAALIILGDDWDMIPPGEHLMRIIKATGDQSQNVKIEMQEDRW